MTDISKTSRMAIRKLVKSLKHYANHKEVEIACDCDCDCDACKAIRYAKKEDEKLTYIIEANKRCCQIVKGK